MGQKSPTLCQEQRTDRKEAGLGWTDVYAVEYIWLAMNTSEAYVLLLKLIRFVNAASTVAAKEAIACRGSSR